MILASQLRVTIPALQRALTGNPDCELGALTVGIRDVTRSGRARLLRFAYTGRRLDPVAITLDRGPGSMRLEAWARESPPRPLHVRVQLLSRDRAEVQHGFHLHGATPLGVQRIGSGVLGADRVRLTLSAESVEEEIVPAVPPASGPLSLHINGAPVALVSWKGGERIEGPGASSVSALTLHTAMCRGCTALAELGNQVGHLHQDRAVTLELRDRRPGRALHRTWRGCLLTRLEYPRLGPAAEGALVRVSVWKPQQLKQPA